MTGVGQGVPDAEGDTRSVACGGSRRFNRVFQTKPAVECRECDPPAGT